MPGLGRSPREGRGNPLQYSCLRSPVDREAWWATIHGVTKDLNMTERLNNTVYIYVYIRTVILL